MAKFRKDDIVIEAFQWTGGHDQSEDPEWIVKALKADEANIFTNTRGDVRMNLRTAKGNLMVCSGNYIIQDADGELSPCEADVFEDTYELIEEESEEKTDA